MPRKPLVPLEVYLVDQPVEPPKELPQFPPTKLERMKGKKKAELDANGKPIVPDGMSAVQVKAKRPYHRKPKTIPASIPENEVVEPKPEPEPKPELKKNAAFEPETESDQEPSRQRSTRPRSKRPPRRYVSETSETSEPDSDSDSWSDSSEEDRKISKYVRKASRKAEMLKKIDEQLKRSSNPYYARNMTIF